VEVFASAAGAEDGVEAAGAEDGVVDLAGEQRAGDGAADLLGVARRGDGAADLVGDGVGPGGAGVGAESASMVLLSMQRMA